MILDMLLQKANENYKTAEWAEKKNYFDTAVSRYYYCAYEKVIYISVKKGFYVRPVSSEESHTNTINRFIKSLNDKLTSEEKIALLKMKKLRRIRNDSDYEESKMDNNSFVLGFKYYFNEINSIVNKYL